MREVSFTRKRATVDFLRITTYRLIERSYAKEQMWRVCYFLIKRKKLLQQPLIIVVPF